MAMTLLKARKRPNGSFRILVHIDSTKMLEDDSPDPAWVRQYDWPPKPSGITQADYVTQLKAETKLLCQLDADDISAAADEGTAMPGEGTPL